MIMTAFWLLVAACFWVGLWLIHPYLFYTVFCIGVLALTGAVYIRWLCVGRHR